MIRHLASNQHTCIFIDWFLLQSYLPSKTVKQTLNSLEAGSCLMQAESNKNISGSIYTI